MAQAKIVQCQICGLAIPLMMLLPSLVQANERGGGAMIMIGGYHVSLAFTAPAQAGRNLVRVQIMDGTAMPVSGARLEISAMPVENKQHAENRGSGTQTMGDMQGMEHAPVIVPANNMPSADRVLATQMVAPSNNLSKLTGDYFGIINFSAGGHWMLNTRLSINGQTLDADFPVDVAGGSASFAILAGFFVLNAVIIWAASVIRRKAFLSDLSG